MKIHTLLFSMLFLNNTAFCATDLGEASDPKNGDSILSLNWQDERALLKSYQDKIQNVTTETSMKMLKYIDRAIALVDTLEAISNTTSKSSNRKTLFAKFMDEYQEIKNKLQELDANAQSVSTPENSESPALIATSDFHTSKPKLSKKYFDEEDLEKSAEPNRMGMPSASTTKAQDIKEKDPF
jgi:hypothetical protein